MTPRITLAVLAYKQSSTIDAAVESALAQICEPIEILLSDDASPDNTFERMQMLGDTYQGPHQIHVRKNTTNLGIGAHINTVVDVAAGDLLVVMAGDDISLPDRVAHIAYAWDASGQKLDLIASNLIDMSQDGHDMGMIRVDDLSCWHTVDDWAHKRPYIVGAAHAFTRRMYKHFGPIQQGVSYEDQVNVLRALCSGGACTLDKPLVRYRRGGVSDRMREFSGDLFISWTKRLNSAHISLHRQWLLDAKIGGCYDVVQQAIDNEQQRALFIESLLNARNFISRCGVTMKQSPIDFKWRLRKCLYFGWPSLAATTRAFQSALKSRKRG